MVLPGYLRRSVAPTGPVLLPLLLALGCATGTATVVSDVKDDALFFVDPQQAVTTVTDLLRREAFAELSRYYDLEGSEVPREALTSGRFFVRSERPPAAHPGGFWRYREPFAPGFRYAGHTIEDDDVARVNVRIEIDQGDGMVQTGERTFRLRRHPGGWQLLPSG